MFSMAAEPQAYIINCSYASTNDILHLSEKTLIVDLASSYCRERERE